jgi:hypothetical protein
MSTTTTSCWSTGYWLRNCEGFRVETEDGNHGLVDRVELAAGGDPVAFLVRFGERFAYVTRVPVRAVEELDPVGEMITLGPMSGVRRSADRQLRIPTAV